MCLSECVHPTEARPNTDFLRLSFSDAKRVIGERIVRVASEELHPPENNLPLRWEMKWNLFKHFIHDFGKEGSRISHWGWNFQNISLLWRNIGKNRTWTPLLSLETQILFLTNILSGRFTFCMWTNTRCIRRTTHDCRFLLTIATHQNPLCHEAQAEDFLTWPPTILSSSLCGKRPEKIDGLYPAPMLQSIFLHLDDSM